MDDYTFRDLTKKIKERVGKKWMQEFIYWLNKEGHPSISLPTLDGYIVGAHGRGKFQPENLEKKRKSIYPLLKQFLSSKENNFFPSYWKIFFFHTIPPNYKTPRLGQGILHIIDDKNIKLFNVNDQDSRGKERGKISLFTDNVMFLDLASIENNESHLHIKINKREYPTEILLGGFTSREKNTITVGTILLEKLELNSENNETTNILSISDPKFTEIDESIRKFLSRKDQNYLKIPHNIYSLKRLKEKISAHRRKRRYETIFYEHRALIVYFSAPYNSISPEKRSKMQDMVKRIIEKLSDYCNPKDFSFYPVYLAGEPEISYNKMQDYLKHTSIFVMFYFDKVSSASLVELGMALSCSKKVCIFCNSQTLPHTIQNMANDAEGVICKVESREEKIYSTILSQIHSYFDDDSFV